MTEGEVIGEARREGGIQVIHQMSMTDTQHGGKGLRRDHGEEMKVNHQPNMRLKLGDTGLRDTLPRDRLAGEEK